MEDSCKIYHICECCDQIYKITESLIEIEPGLESLTDQASEDIMISKPEYGNGMVLGLCDDCHEEIYGVSDHIFYSSIIN